MTNMALKPPSHNVSELDFLRKSGPYSIIDDSFPATPRPPPTLQPLKDTSKGSIHSSPFRTPKAVRSRIPVFHYASPKARSSPRANGEFASLGIINITDFVKFSGEVTQTAVRRSQPIQPPKLRQFLHRELLRKRQLTIREGGCVTGRDIGEKKRLYASLDAEWINSRSPSRGMSPGRNRVRRGLVCKSMRKSLDGNRNGVKTVGKSMEFAMRSRPVTSSRHL